MIETTDEAVTYLEMVARRESGDLAEAALIVTRTLRQATQTLADHAQEQAKATAQKAAAARVKELEAKHESAGAALYAGLCRAAIERILAGPEKWVDQPHDIMLRLESYIRRAEALEAAEAENAALRAERDSADRGVARNAEVAAQMMRERDEARAERDRLKEDRQRIIEALGVVHCPECEAVFMVTVPALASGEESREPEKGGCICASGAECNLGLCGQEYPEPASAGPAEEVKRG